MRARVRRLADRGEWSKPGLRWRLLGVRVEEETPERVVLRLPRWMAGLMRSIGVERIERKVNLDAEMVGVTVKLTLGNRLVKLERRVTG